MSFLHIKPAFVGACFSRRSFLRTAHNSQLKCNQILNRRQRNEHHQQTRVSFFSTSKATHATASSAATGEEKLKTLATSLNITNEQIKKLLQLTEMVMTTNKLYNLTAIRTTEEIYIKHIIDAFTLLPIIDSENNIKSIIDIGSGAGFPGFVLGIVRPHLQITLLDSVRKKTNFHQQVIDELDMHNVNSIWSRAEDGCSIEKGQLHREKYCLCVARSVARMNVLAELTLPFVKVGGLCIAQKMIMLDNYDEVDQAKHAIEILGGSVECIDRDVWPEEYGPGGWIEDDDGNRKVKSFVVVRKVKRTHGKYPRKPGVPFKIPLS